MNNLSDNTASQENKFLICDHCKQLNEVGAVKCRSCGYFITSKEAVDEERAKEILITEYRKRAETDKAKYEKAMKKHRITTIVLTSIIAVWAVVTGVVWMFATLNAPEDKTVPVEYKPYSQELSVGDRAEIEVSSGFLLATLRINKKVNNSSVPSEEFYYYLVSCTNGESGIIKIHHWKAKGAFSPNYMFFKSEEPITFYGTVVEPPDEAIEKYENRYSDFEEDETDLRSILEEYDNLEVSDNKVTTEVVEHEKTEMEKAAKTLLYMLPVILILLCCLLARRKPRRKYKDLPLNVTDLPDNQIKL